MAQWEMKCLLCQAAPAEQRSSTLVWSNLVAIQEHAMYDHGYKQDDIRNGSKRQLEDGGYIFTFPDGKDWMEGHRVGGNTTVGI
jgi:hypothetical protein